MTDNACPPHRRNALYIGIVSMLTSKNEGVTIFVRTTLQKDKGEMLAFRHKK